MIPLSNSPVKRARKEFFRPPPAIAFFMFSKTQGARARLKSARKKDPTTPPTLTLNGLVLVHWVRSAECIGCARLSALGELTRVHWLDSTECIGCDRHPPFYMIYTFHRWGQTPRASAIPWGQTPKKD